MSQFYVERQPWEHWPKALITHRKMNDGTEETRKYVPDRGTCRDVGRYAFVCSECGWASDEPHHVLGGFWPKYCPECGRAVVE